MRLTVFVKGANREKVEVKSKGQLVMKEIIKNTFSFNDVKPMEVDRIINEINSREGIEVTGHSLSGQKILGRIKNKKKK
jgi:hypothetical protein